MIGKDGLAFNKPMNYFSYLEQGCPVLSSIAIAEDSSVLSLKMPLDQSFPMRLKRVRSLIDFVPREKAKKIIAEGVSLIRTIPGEDAHRKITNYLLRVFQGDATRDDFIIYLMRLGGVDEDRAVMIADDQMNKASERFLVEKWKSQGCKRVRWVHKDDMNPRQYHLRPWNGISGKRNGRPNGLNGYEFDIDKPPVINQKTKERGYPGQMINCHCRLEPIWE